MIFYTTYITQGGDRYGSDYCRKKGKGKTKHLLDMANAAIKGANGTVVYLDKSAQHMYELNNRIRLINVNEFPVASAEGFLGFICGIISQDHDLETMYLDSFLKLSALEGADITETYETLKKSVINIM